MSKEKIIAFDYKKINYIKYGLIVFMLLTFSFLALIDNKKDTSDKLTIIGWFAFFILVTIFLAIRQKNEYEYYNSLIALSKYQLNKKNLYNSSMIEHSANTIIEKKLKKNDLVYWKKNEKNIDEPYAISLGESCVYNILQLSDEKDIKQASKLYTNFTLSKVLENREKAIAFEKSTIKNSNRRYQFAESKAKNENLNINNVLDEDEKKFKENSLKEQKNKEEQSELKINLGFCPYCFKKIKQLTRKCPHCTADL